MKLSLAASAALIGLALPVVAQERVWSVGQDGDNVFLAFGVPDTADVGVSFWCKGGNPAVSLFTPVPDATTEKSEAVTLSVNGHDYALNAQAGDGSIEAALQPQDKILEDLRASDRFSVRIGKHNVAYPLADADFDEFTRECATPPAGEAQ